MSTDSSPPAPSSFARFVGRWTGTACVYSPEGKLLKAMDAEVAIVPVGENVLSYEQRISGSELKGLFTVVGKLGKAETDDYTLTAVESAPGIFLITIRSKRSKVVYYNNHYFQSPDLRNVIGPTVVDGQVTALNVHTYTRSPV